jgi:AraC-like DNA-binding protein
MERTMTQAIDYLEENLERTVRMEKAAELANCSLFHFCRMFAVVFGSVPATTSADDVA